MMKGPERGQCSTEMCSTEMCAARAPLADSPVVKGEPVREDVQDEGEVFR